MFLSPSITMFAHPAKGLVKTGFSIIFYSIIPRNSL
jgi:hypothetical protein